MRSLEFESRLSADRASVWRSVTSMDGVNAELLPWVRMTFPSEAKDLRLEDAPLGTLVFRSWLLAFGFVPFDLHALTMAEVREYGFVEESSSWLQSRWRHERWIDEAGTGCVVRDRLTFEPRIRVFEPVVALIVGALFRHRHRRLRERFGARATHL